MKRALAIRHAPDEGVAGLRAPIEAAGYRLERVDVRDAAFATMDLAAPDLLILMGGPMGVYERAEHPWIDGEVARLAGRIARGLPTLGVCLGAQMIAQAMGAKVVVGAVREVGFAPVALTQAGARSPLRHLAGVPVLHWHGDTFALPEGVDLLASTMGCAHQAFARGRALLALQFHPEMGEDARFEGWLDGSEDYAAGAGISIARLRADHARFGPAAVAAGRAMMAEWLAGL